MMDACQRLSAWSTWTSDSRSLRISACSLASSISLCMSRMVACCSTRFWWPHQATFCKSRFACLARSSHVAGSSGCSEISSWPNTVEYSFSSALMPGHSHSSNSSVSRPLASFCGFSTPRRLCSAGAGAASFSSAGRFPALLEPGCEEYSARWVPLPCGFP